MVSSSTPTLGVIVPATDAPPTLRRCLAALAAGEAQPDELLVQRTPRGAGPAAARNLAAARARADVLVFVDSDVVVHADALARVRAAFAADEALVALFGAYDDRPASPDLVSRYRNLLHHHVHWQALGEANTFWAGLGAVRREAFQRAGGFDERRYPDAAIEDVELGARLHAAGARIVLDPAIRGTHLKRWSLASMVRTDLTRRGIPWARLVLETGAASDSLNLSPRRRLSAAALAAAAISMLAGRRRAALLAAGVMAASNLPLYALLARRGGPPLLAAGAALHGLHEATAIAAAALGAVMHAAAGCPRRSLA